MAANSHVDERVVEMRIDHENFERGANKTISLLEKLEKALHIKGDSKELDNAADAVEKLGRATSKFDASPMSESLGKVTASFTALEIAGMRVISNLTDSIYQFAARTVKQLTIEPVTEGYGKYEEKISNVQTIMNSTGKTLEEVNEYLDQLMWYSDETSFSFTDMTSALATMTSTGGDIEKLIPLLEGVGNAVAYAGKGPAEFTRSIRNLAQSYSGGYLTLMDWRSLQLAGTSSKALQESLIRSAEELHKIQKGEITISNFTETLKDKWADTEVMERAFQYFAAMTEKAKELIAAGQFENATEAYEYLADHFDEIQSKAALAAQQAKTFKEVIDAVKDAVSSGWMTTFETLFGDLKNAAEFWTDMYDPIMELFGGGAERRNSILSIAFGQGAKTGNLEKTANGWKKLEESISSSGKSMAEFESAAKKVFSSSGSGDVNSLIERYGSIEEAFKQGAITADMFRQIMSELKGETQTTADSVNTSANAMGQGLDQLRGVALGILRGDYKNGSDRRKMLEELGYDYELMQAMAGQLANGWENISDEQLMSLMEIYYQYNNLSERLGAKTFSEYLTQMQAASAGATQARDEIDELYDSIVGVSGAEEEMVDRGSEFRQAILNILDAIVSIKRVFTGFTDSKGIEHLGAFAKVFGTVEERGEKLGNLIHNFYLLTENIGFSEDALIGLEKVFEGFFRVIKTIGSVLKAGFSGAFSVIMEFSEFVDDVLSMVGRGEFTIGGVLDSLNEHLHNLIPTGDDVKNAIKRIGKAFLDLIPSEDQLIQFYQDLKKQVLNFPKNLFAFLSPEHIKSMLPSLESIKNIFHEFTGYMEENYPRLTAWFKQWKASTFIGKALSSAGNGIEKISEWLSNFKMDTSGISAFFQQFKQITDFLFGGLIGDTSSVKASVSTFIDTIINAFQQTVSEKKIELADIFEGLRTIGLVMLLGELAALLNSVKKVAKQATSIGEAITNFVDKGTEVLDMVKKSVAANLLIKVAVALVMLAGALWVLSKIPAETLTHVAVVMGLLMVVMYSIAKKLENSSLFANNNGTYIQVFSNFASTLIGFAMILGGLSALLLIGKNMSIGQIGVIFGAVAVIIALLAVVAKKMSALKFENPAGPVMTIMSIALAIDLLIPTMIVMALMPWQSWVKAVLGVAGLLVALGVMTSWMSKIGAKDSGMGATNLLKTAGSMAIMAAAVKMLMGPLIVLAAIPLDMIMNGFIAVGALMAMMMVVTLLMSMMKPKDSTGMLKMAAAMAIIAVAINLLVPAIISLATFVTALIVTVPWENLSDKIEAFQKALKPLVNGVLILMGFGAALLLIGFAATTFGVGMLAAAASLVLFAVGTYVITAAIKKLIDALPALIDGVNHIRDNFTWGTAVTLLAIAAALAIMAVSLSKVVTAIAKLVRAASTGVKISKFGSTLLASLGTFGTKVLKNIQAALPKIIPIILNMLSTILIMAGVKLLDIMPQLVELGVQGIIQFFTSLAAAMQNNKDALVQSITDILKAVLDVVHDVISNIFSKDFWEGISVGERILYGLATALAVVLGVYKKFSSVSAPKGAGGLLGSLIKGGKGAAAGGEIAAAGGAASSAAGGFSSLVSALGGLATILPFAIVGVSALGSLISIHRQESRYTAEAFEGLSRSSDDYVTAIQRQQTELERCNTDYQNLVQYGGDLTMIQEEMDVRQNTLNKTYQDFANILGISVEELQRQIDAANGDISQIEALKQKTEEYNQVSRNIGSGNEHDDFNAWRNRRQQIEDTTASVNELSSVTDGVESELAGIPQSVLDTQDDTMRAGQTVGEAGADSIVDTLVTTMTGGKAKGTITGSGETSSSYWFSGMESGSGSRAPGAADYSVGALVNALNSYMGDLYTSGWNGADSYYSGWADRLQENSPSRVMMRSGEYAVKGLLIGLSSNTSDIYNSGTELGNNLVDAVSRSMSDVSMLASEEFEFSPVISPVVDMSNVNSATGYMNGALSKKFSISAQMSGNLSHSINEVQQVAVESGDRSDLLYEVRMLSQQVGELESSISNMQIVLDTGVLVGSTSAKMDSQFGKMAMRRGRGN